MLTIEHCDIEETVKVGDLFNELGFSSSTPASDETGDSYIINEWGIEVLSLDAYYPVEGFRWTKPEPQVRLFHRSLGSQLEEKYLQCSPDHVVLRQGDEPAWFHVKDLNPGDLITTKNGISYVTEVKGVTDVERLCDIQVSIAHSYFTDDVLSHNSHFLTFLGANALRAGTDVLHYTFELSEAAVGRRYDSNLCEVDSNDVIEGKEAIIAKYKDAKLGRLMIKEFPTNTASIYTLRSHIERLDLKGFQPGLIIIDYADIMRSTRQYDSLRHELKLIYEELRGFAGEKLVPIWTACFHGDTEVATPTGKFKIKDRVGQSGFPVYAYNHETKRLELRTVKHVYKSGDNVHVWKVTLDNGREVIATPTHKFMRRDGSYTELKDLVVGDSLMPFYERDVKGRAMIYRNDGKWEHRYRMVAEWKYGNIPALHQIHHVDFDKRNDHPDNLQMLSISEHYRIHGRHSWDPSVPCSLNRLHEQYVQRMRDNNPMSDPEVVKKMSKSRRGKCTGDDNPMRFVENAQKVGNSLRTSACFAAYKATAAGKASNWWSRQTPDDRRLRGMQIIAGRYNLSYDEYVAQLVDARQRCVDALSVSKTMKSYMQQVRVVPLDRLTKQNIWQNKNHVVMKVEPWGTADVYNMEVDDLHNYALDAGVVVKNSQSNKEGSQSDIVDLSNMSEAYGKAMVADVVLSISRKSHEKSKGWGRLFVAKNRAGRDGIVYPIKIDTARSKFEISGVPGDLEEARTDDDNSTKRALRQKWQELRGDALLAKPQENNKAEEPKSSGE